MSQEVSQVPAISPHLRAARTAGGICMATALCRASNKRLLHTREPTRRAETDCRPGPHGRATNHGAGGRRHGEASGKNASSILTSHWTRKGQVIKMLGAFCPITLICQVVGCLRSSCYYRANSSNDTRLLEDAAEPRKAQKTENDHQESAKGVSATGIEASRF